jgi:hypothetical protein
MGKIHKPEEESTEFFVGSNGKYTTKTKFYVDYIDYDENRNISDLIIRDHKGNSRFEQLTDKTEKEINAQFLKLKDLIVKNEEKDDNFDRSKFYEHFKVSSDNQLNLKQRAIAIKLLEQRLKK